MGRYPEQAHHAHHAHPDPGGGSWADLVEILGFLLIVTGWGALTAAAGMVATGLGVLVAGVGLAVAGGIACWAAVQLHRPPSPAPAEAEPPVIGGPA